MLTQSVISNFVIGSFLLLVLLVFNAMGIQTGALVVVTIPYLFFLIINPRRALLATWAFLFFLPMLIRSYMGSFSYHVGNEVIVTVLWCAWLGKLLITRGNHGVPKPLLRLGVAVLFVSFISMFLNRSNPIHWVEWVFSYLLPLPVIGIARLHLDDYTAKRILRIAIPVLFLQFVLNMGWHAGINPLRNEQMLWIDLSMGTYGNTAGTAYLFIAAMTGGLCYACAKAVGPGRKLLAALLMIIAGIQVFFTYSTHAHVFLPIAAVTPLFFVTKSERSNSARVTINITLIIVIASLAIAPLARNRLGRHHRIIGPSKTEFAGSVWNSVWYGPKVDVIRKVLNEATSVQMLVGMGPNAAVSYTAFLLRTPQTFRLIGEWFYTLSGREEISTGSIRENLFSGTVMLISEVGILGMILYFAMLIYPLWHLYRKVRTYPPDGQAWLFLTGTVFMLFMINLGIGIVWDVWRMRMLSTTSWLLLGRVWDPPHQPPKKNTPENENETETE